MTIRSGQRLGVALAISLAGCMPPSWGANAMLHPQRRPLTRQPDRPFESVELDGDGVKLKGWWFHPAARGPASRGTVIVLHGVADNRGSSVGVADHFLARGFDVVAYDSRAHGESGGDACTYGYYEKRDLHDVIDRLQAKPVVLLGFSMGAAVALQEAADDPRVGVVVAVSSFSDLRTAATERAPFFASQSNLDEAFRLAEQEGKFRVDEVSPVAAAPRVAAAALIIHGDHDDETPPSHSERIFAALTHRKHLVLVPNASHSHVLTADVWREIDGWIDTALAEHGPPAVQAR